MNVSLEYKRNSSFPGSYAAMLGLFSGGAMRERGINSTGRDVADIIICSQDDADDALKSGLPVILAERSDGPNLSRVEGYFGHKNIVAVWKGNVFRDLALYNEPRHHLRYHGNICRKASGGVVSGEAERPPEIPCDQIEKLSVVYSQSSFYGKEYPLDTKRDITVHFAGTVKYSGNPEWLHWHRGQACDLADKISGSVVRRGLSVPQDKYYDELSRSKICLSPWGFGEVCHRDFEAIRAGCVLVKPDTSHIRTWVDIYNNNTHYIPCRVDFSDLPDIVEAVASGWGNYGDMRSKAQAMLMNECTKDKLADRIATLFHNVFKRLHREHFNAD